MGVAPQHGFSPVSPGASKQLAGRSSCDIVVPINFAVKWCGATAAKDRSRLF
jgi:hypothetical protein